MISRHNTYDKAYALCTNAFPPGKLFSIPPQPDVDVVNSIGGYTLARDRLAYIDGEADPWREVTVHSSLAPVRTSSDERPLYLIPGGVHCYDTNEIPSKEPASVLDAHTFIRNFVGEWLDEWKASRP